MMPDGLLPNDDLIPSVSGRVRKDVPADSPPSIEAQEHFSVFAQMELSRVIVSELNDQQAIYLREVGGTRTFPILIGQFEVQIINRRLLEEPPFRPMTHQLLKNIVETLGGRIEEVVITEMKDHTYYAILKIKVGDMVHNIDCRPSDAIAMAVHHQPTLPIFVAEQVLSEVASG